MLFEAKTQTGFSIKKMVELLQNNVRTSCLELRKDGIHLCQMNDKGTVSIEIFLDAEEFLVYRLDSDEPIRMGIKSSILYKTLKDIKKTEMLKISKDTVSSKLVFENIPRDSGTGMITSITVQNFQALYIDVPPKSAFNSPITFQSNEFSKTIKSLGNTGKTITVSANENFLTFSSSTHGIFSRSGRFGNTEIRDTNVEETEIGTFTYQRLSKLIKISGLGDVIKMYWATPDENSSMPLLLESAISFIGTIRIYIRTEEDIEAQMEDES
ncbi:MAG: hypothetical protein JKX76_02240 [Colwellia sp.]|nr:hypothetical protein [Colwellia sp.]